MVGPRIDLLIDRARAGECDLIAKSGGDHDEDGVLGGDEEDAGSDPANAASVQ